MKIIIMQGPPASGKSTWVRGYMKDHSDTTRVVCRDDIRDELGSYDHSRQIEAEVTRIEDERMRQALAEGFDVINDGTNLNPKYLPKWEALAAEFGAEIEYRKFYVPFKEAVRRSKNPDRKHPIEKSVIKRFYRLYFNDEYEKELLKTVDHFRLPADTTLPSAVMCDLDGTVAWMQGRSPYSTRDVDRDKVDPNLSVLLGLLMSMGVTLIFVSGRMGNDECRQKTYDWIKANIPDCVSHKLDGDHDRFILLMRKDKDNRADEIVKKEIFENEIKGRYNVIAVFDDRDKVVRMWRETGLLCCQVADGDF